MKKKNFGLQREELELLSTPELSDRLRAELDSDSPNTEAVLLILNILENRDPQGLCDRPAGVDAAWEKYLREHRRIRGSSSAPQRKIGKWIGVAAAVVIVALLFIFVPQSSVAEDLFTLIGRWTQDIFQFGPYSETEDVPECASVYQTEHPGLRQLYDTVVEQGVTQRVVPTWLPEGYELTELKVVPQSDMKKVIGHFRNGDRYIEIIFEIYTDADSNTYYKSEGDASLYEYAGKCHYITPNAEKYTAVWGTGNTECFILTNDTEKELHRILKSIYLYGG